MSLKLIATEIAERLKNLPKFWDGKSAITEMKERNNRNWKQMEWIGFYFQFLRENYLNEYMEIPGRRIGNVKFDAFKEIPWDFKAHALNTSTHQVIINDSSAVAEAIKVYGAVGLILALGKVEYNDENRTFQKWHEELKGGPSEYTIERISRGAWSRLLKVSFDLQQISLIKIDDSVLIKCGSFQEDFRNADGSPRNPKVLLDLEKIDDKNELIHFIEFHKVE